MNILNKQVQDHGGDEPNLLKHQIYAWERDRYVKTHCYDISYVSSMNVWKFKDNIIKLVITLYTKLQKLKMWFEW